MKTSTKVIAISSAVALSSATASYCTYQLTRLSQAPDSTYDFEDLHVDEYLATIQEINKNNTDLVVYEISPTSYRAVYKEGEILPVQSTFVAKYSYSLSIDLSKATTYSIGNQVYVVVNLSNVKLHKIQIEDMSLIPENGPLSLLFKSKAATRLNSVALDKSEDSINRLVKTDIHSNKDTIQTNVYNKLNSLYREFNNVHIIVQGEVN